MISDSDSERDRMSSSSDNSFDDKSKEVAIAIAAPRATRAAALVCKAKLQNSSNVEAVMKAEDKPKKKSLNFDFERLLADPLFNQPHLYRKMQPEEFTEDYYRKSGFKQVLIFDCDPKELKMKMVDDNFTARDVERFVGGDKMITVVEVESQGSVDMPLKKFINYYYTPKQDKKILYNVLSLEFSNSALSDYVQAPQLIRSIDWASLWPDERRTRTVVHDKNRHFTTTNNYPRVENYCLMSPTECYTDFHIDFHGTSVWYHVKKGMKVFWIIEPTEKNIMLYEEYLKSFDSTDFFGYMADKCARVEVRPGNTLILPSGWIHAVFTPEDSLVFGGNFLHSRQILMQLNVLQGEKRIGVNKKFRYPLAEEVVWFLFNHIVKSVTDRQYVRPASRNQQDQYMEYVGDMFVARNLHHRVPQQEDYEDDGMAWNQLWDETEEYTEWIKKLAIFEKETKDDNGINYGEKRRLASRTLVKVKDPNIEEEMEDEEEEEEGKEENDNVEKPVFGGHEDWFPDHTTFFHPESFGLDAGMGATAIHTFPVSDKEPPLRYHRDRLLKMICPDMIEPFESLVMHFMKKSTVNLPIGLTRPNSLLQAFCNLLLRRRNLAVVEEGLSLPVSILPNRAGILRMHQTQIAAREERKRKKEEKRVKEEEGEAEEDSDYDPDDEKPKKKKGRKSGDEGRKIASSRWPYTSIPPTSVNGYRHPQSLVPSTAHRFFPTMGTHAFSNLRHVPPSTGNRFPVTSTISAPSPIVARTPYRIAYPFSGLVNSNPSSSIFPSTASSSTIARRVPPANYLASVVKNTPIAVMRQDKSSDDFSKLWDVIRTHAPSFQGLSQADSIKRKESLMKEWAGLPQSQKNRFIESAGCKPSEAREQQRSAHVQRQVTTRAPTAVSATMAAQLNGTQQNEISRRQHWIALGNANAAPSPRFIGIQPLAPNAAPTSKPNNDK